MTVILDTHVLIWLASGEMRRVSKRARELLLSKNVDAVVSAASIWEIAIKRNSGKLNAPKDMIELLDRAGLRQLPITAEHAEHAGSLKLHHRDPFDRMLVAQSAREGMPIVTNDKKFGLYSADVFW